MKRSLLLLSTFMVGGLCAQQATQTTSPRTGKYAHVPSVLRQSNTNSNPHTSSTPIFSEDFATGLPATWSVVNNAATTEVWHYTTTGAYAGGFGGVSLNPIGTSAANGFMIFDSDSAGSVGVPENCDLFSPVMNCTGHSTVFLEFNQYFREYLMDSCLVGVSTDNVTWTYVYCPDALMPAFTETANPDHIVLNISSIAGNQPTVYLKFHWEGDWDWWWMLDDISVYEPSPYELRALAMSDINAGYTKSPLSQTINLPMKGVVKNEGANAVTTGTAIFEVRDTVSNAVVYWDQISLPAIASLATDTVNAVINFSAPANGYYRGYFKVNVLGDFDTTNNVAASVHVINVNDSVYARDLGPTAILGIGAGPAQGILGQSFQINAADQLTSVSFWLRDSMPVNPAGTPVYVTVHAQIPGQEPGAVIATSDSVIIMPGSIPDPGFLFTVAMNGGPLQLAPGLYFVGVHEVDSLLWLGTSTGIFTPNSTWVTWNTIPSPPAVNGWAPSEAFGFPIAYVLRMNFGPNILGVPVNQESASTTVYPNPSNGILSVGTGSNGTEEVVVTIFDSKGAVVYSTITTSSTMNVDLTLEAAGVYMVQIKNGSNISNKKITITK